MIGLECDHSAGDHTDAHLGSTEILQHSDGDIQSGAEGANSAEDNAMLGMGTVREVEAGHVHPRFDERLELQLAGGGGADRAHDLRLPLHAVRHFGSTKL